MSSNITPAADPSPADGGGRAPLQSILKRDRMVIIGGLVVLTLVSWAYLFYDDWRMRTTGSCCKLAEVDLRTWLRWDLLLLFVMWSIMMVAMMAPTAAPMVLTFAAVNRRRLEARRPYVPTIFFLGGFLVAWTISSALASALQWVLHAK